MGEILNETKIPATRGFSRPGHPAVIGAVVGAIGGTVFIAANAPALSIPWRIASTLSGFVALVLWCWAVLLARRGLPQLPRPGRSAGIVYLAGIVGMFAIMFAGSRLLAALDKEALQPAVIVVAVGAHFLPYGRAFGSPVFFRLGALLAGVGLLGLVMGLALAPVAASACAVVAGLVLLLGIAADAHSQVPRRTRE